jgi:2-oxoisovalerate dehydrogenase E2 component (dihydrolipoyl transacylase)
MTSITMPQLGESVAEGTIGKWLKSPGERIELDEPLVEVITDKVTAEIPSPVAGVLSSILVEEGQTVPIGREIAVIADVGSASPAGPAAEPERAAERTMDSLSGPPRPPVGLAAPSAPPAESPAGESEPAGGGRRATPLVRKLAREHGVDLSQVSGSGSGGRVTKDDILAYVQARAGEPAPAPLMPAAPVAPAVSLGPVAPAPAAASAAAPSPGGPSSAAATPPPAPGVARPGPGATAGAGADEEYLPLTPMRRSIAEHMVRSRQVSPDAWCLVEVDVTSLARVREALLADWQQREGFELTYLPFFLKAVVESLREHPILNASWGGDQIVLKRRINVGIAVAVEAGLVVPVIQDADQRSIAGLAHAVRDLAIRARAGKLALSDLQGGTFTVNNTGALGSIMSQPIINQPQAAIVTMEAIVKRPVVVADDALAIRSMMNVCLSFDHRILDGAQALRFLQAVKRRLEAYGPSSPIY